MPSGEVDVCPSLRACFRVFRARCDKYSIEVATTGAIVFNLTLVVSITLGEQRELLDCVERLPASICSSKKQIQLLERQTLEQVRIYASRS